MDGIKRERMMISLIDNMTMTSNTLGEKKSSSVTLQPNLCLHDKLIKKITVSCKTYVLILPGEKSFT